MRIIINGVGVAGPTLAYWLRRSGHQVLLVEAASALRRGGYVIDFWGLGYDIAERMGVLPRVRALGYQAKEVRFVNDHGRTNGGFSVDVFGRATNGRFTSVRRSDLSATIYAALDGQVETLFGDSVSAIDDRGDGVHVSFERSAPRDADLVIGADGLHSRVRALRFGAESDVEVTLGYHVAAFEVGGYQPRDELVYVSHGVPGRQISRFALRDDRTLFLCVFRDEYMQADEPVTDRDRRAVVERVYDGVGWEAPQMLACMERANEIYFDRVSQIRMPAWTRGRAALVGDAAACVSLLAGEGTGLAMVEAYVLAGELRVSGGDHVAAFAGYERRLMPFLAAKQASAAKFASSFAPRTQFGLWFRDHVTRLFRVPAVADDFIGRDLRDDIELPDYDW